MRVFDLIAVLLVMAAGFSYLNYRWLKLPQTIGLMALTLVCAVVLVGVGKLYPPVVSHLEDFVHELEFKRTVLDGMLGFLLFAGSLHVNLNDLAGRKWIVGSLATIGVVISTALVGSLMWAVTAALGIPLPPVYCFLFGALISPTDPIAVLAILKYVGVPKRLEVTVAGESLFNDGVGVVIFLGLLELATGTKGLDPGHLGLLFAQETLGGAAFGLAAGLIAYFLIRPVDHYQVEIMLSLALVAGGYALANALHLSGPIAMVVAGLLIGNHGRNFAMSRQSAERLDHFWELIDEVLNAVLFVLIGLEVLILPFAGKYVLAGLCAIPVVLLARLLAVSLPVRVLGRWRSFDRGTVAILTWGGLRGGLSVAMALSLPEEPDDVVPVREVLLLVTYVVVVFSILVQGLTIGPLSRRWLAPSVTPQPGPRPHDAISHEPSSATG